MKAIATTSFFVVCAIQITKAFLPVSHYRVSVNLQSSVVPPLSAASNGMPFELWEFLDCDNRNKDPIEPGRVDEIARLISKSDVTDLIIVSHGWRNSFREAAKSYEMLASNIVKNLKESRLGGSKVKLGLIGIRWPSLVCDKLNPQTFERSIEDKRDEKTFVLDEIDQLIEFFPDDKALLEEAKAALKKSRTSPIAAKSSYGMIGDSDSEFFEAIAKLFDTSGASSGANFRSMQIGHPDKNMMGNNVKQALSKADAVDLLGWHRSKTRAAKTGFEIVSPALRRLRKLIEREVPKFHLVGHSFGGLLVASSASALKEGEQYDSMTLLQAAFSHNAFSENFDFTGGSGPGMFHHILENNLIQGPLVATHTSNDGWLGRQAILWPYTNRARTFEENGRVIPGSPRVIPALLKRRLDVGPTNPDDEYGAIGANGAQHTMELVQHYPKSFAGKLHLEKFNNVQGHEEARWWWNKRNMISGHSDVWNEKVAKLIIDVIASSQ